jgi:maltooligosyltrehalose trehalohydrolase
VELTVEPAPGGAAIPDRTLRPADGGWFVLDDGLAAGTDYRFRLDGGEPLPDPRSRWQPHGVHGPSRVHDPQAYRWSDHDWRPPALADAVLYELHVGTFTPAGTFAAAAARLDHLVGLGVTHVELMPVHAFAGRHGWGYDSVGLFAPHPTYGHPDDLKSFVDDCHGRGLAVVLDVVYNHLGPEGNYLPCFGPYLTDRYRTPWGDAVNLDGPGSDEVRRFLIDNARSWLGEFHVDGLRLDAVHALVDTTAVHLLEELAEAVRALEADLGRPTLLIAESDRNDPRLVRDPSQGGFGLDGHWVDDLHHGVHVALTGERSGYYEDYRGLADVADAYRHGYVYRRRHSPHRGHRVGRDPAGVPGTRLVASLQTHDQVGNRARGERITRLASPGRVKAGAALVLLAPFVPLLFAGEEWGASSPFPFFADHGPDLADAVRRGRLDEFAAFGWDPDDVPDPESATTRDLAVLRWEELGTPAADELLSWYRELLALRRATPALRDGDRDGGAVWLADDEASIVVRRGDITLAVHLGDTPRRLPLHHDPREAPEPVLVSHPATPLDPDGVVLPADGTAVLRWVPGDVPVKGSPWTGSGR